jgi:hypothetical protein
MSQPISSFMERKVWVVDMAPLGHDRSGIPISMDVPLGAVIGACYFFLDPDGVGFDDAPPCNPSDMPINTPLTSAE